MKEAVEVVVLRLVPGLINLLAFLSLATWLSRESYGVASTYIATAGAASNLIFGPLVHSTLIHHSEHWKRGEQARFERVHVANTLLIGVGAVVIGVLAASTGLFDWRIAAAATALGIYTAVQEISHARLQFVRFGIGSTAQSLAFLALAFALVRGDASVERALDAFTISYVAGAALSLLLARTGVARPSLKMLKDAYAIGTMPALSNLAVDAFTLGCRYVLLAFGRLDALGIFSFSVDLAQRTVGIFVNLATFAVVPRALKASGDGEIRELWQTLVRGWAWAVGIALLSATAILAVGTTALLPALNRSVFDPVSFALIALAVIVNRSGKMLLSPVAMRLRRTRHLLMPLIVIAPAVLVLVAIGIQARLPYAVEIGYAVAFAAWIAAAYRSLVPSVMKSLDFS